VSETRALLSSVINEGRKFLLEPEAKRLCASYGIPVTNFKMAKNIEEAVKYAHEIGYPVVVKVVSPDILHKTDVGGVVLNINNDEELEKACNMINSNVRKYRPRARILGYLIEEYAPSSIEVIVGVKMDPQFGHVIMFGLGGVFVEILKDVTFRILPITDDDAEEMIHEIRGYPLLVGYRGQPPVDIVTIREIILKVSNMVMENPVIKELDLNPIRVYSKGAKVLDARVILAN